MAIPLPIKLTIDPVKSTAKKPVKINIPVRASDTTGTPVSTDLALLDDASIEAWLSQISDWKIKLHYRALLNKAKTYAIVPTPVPAVTADSGPSNP